jgi:hypothetical protein
MVQSTLERTLNFFNRLLDTVVGVLPWILVILGILLVFGIVLYALDKGAYARARDFLGSRTRLWFVWAGVAVVALVGAFMVSVAQRAVQLRFQNQQSAQFSTREDPSGGQTVQDSPNVSVARTVTFTRRFTLPPDFARRLGDDPENTLRGYIGYGINLNGTLKDVQDGFQRSASGLLYTRTFTVEQNDPVVLEAANVGADFDFGDTGAGRSYYRAAFTGRYRFSNPLDTPARMRFTFPLPEGSGTLSEFSMSVNGKPVQQADLERGYIWEGSVDAKAQLEIVVKYRNQGARTWSYRFGFRREPIRDFSLRVNSPRAVSYLRGSLYPTNQTGALEWNLKNIITSQSVVIAFPELSLRETLTKLYTFAPAALALALLWSLLYGLRRGLPLEPARFALALVGIALGLSVSSVLLGYLPTALALILGAVVAAALGVLALGVPFALPVVASSLAPLAFLTGGNAGLWLALGALVFVVSLLPGDALSRGQRGRAPSSP